MALIKCDECGHMVSDLAEACPKCGCPVNGEETFRNEEYVEERKKNKWWIWTIVAFLLILIAGSVYYIYSNDSTNASGDRNKKDFTLEDGEYCYKGEWVSEIYEPQPCLVEFKKDGNSLTNCAYVNLNYNVRIPLEGTIDGNKLHFEGVIDNKPLTIDLTIDDDGNRLKGRGVDHAHQSNEAKLDLEKTDYNNEYKQNVAALKALLASTDGMTFGNDAIQLVKSSYDEEKNIVRFRFIQHVFPRSEETTELLDMASKVSRETRIRALRNATPLLNAMKPLHPKILDVVCYPDGGKCYSYTISFNELYSDGSDNSSYGTSNYINAIDYEYYTPNPTTNNSEDAMMRKWLIGQWGRSDIDRIEYKIVYYVFTFNENGYNYAEGSEDDFSSSNRYSNYTIRDNIIYTADGTPLLIIDKSDDCLIRYNYHNEVYRRLH